MGVGLAWPFFEWMEGPAVAVSNTLVCQRTLPDAASMQNAANASPPPSRANALVR